MFFRLKSSRSSIDAQTISTFDSSGDQSGFYRNYQQAWENLRFAGSSPAAYKPTNPASLGRNGHHVHHHNHGLEIDTPFTQSRATRTGGNGTYNEGFRDTNEITLNADVAALYSRGGGSNGSTPPGIPSNNRKNNYDSQPWKRKY